MKIYNVTPNTKPRMTRRDKWAKRPCVLKYFSFKDDVRAAKIELPDSYHVIFVMPMPKWTKKKRIEMNGKPHRQTPDKDNLEKALLDALYDDDSHVWDGRITKIWGENGQIIVNKIEPYDKGEL
jgi:Holliday junction resolvase RusA-like endonuclease